MKSAINSGITVNRIKSPYSQAGGSLKKFGMKRTHMFGRLRLSVHVTI
jgi:hypothetical protein